MRLGEFDPKAKVSFAGIKPGIINDPAHHDLAVEIAEKTPVLLKNIRQAESGKKALPINLKQIRKIAVLGPQADKVELGDYSGPVEPELRISPLQGIRSYIADHNLSTEVITRSGGNTKSRTDFLQLTNFSTVSGGKVLMEYDAAKFDKAANGVLASYRFGQTVLQGIKDGDWTQYNNIDITGVDSIRFNMGVSTEGGILEVRVGSASGNILASEEIKPARPSGNFGNSRRNRIIPVKINNLGISGPQNLVLVFKEAAGTAIDQETLDMAASADVALIFVGTDQSTGREEADRYSLKLPGNQNELIQAVAEVNPNTIVVIQTMGMVEVEQFKNLPNVSGIIWTGYNGQAQGTAMAKILFGDVNPGGKLNVTWHKSLNDLPELNDYTLRGDGTNGRTYWYYNKEVSYEFGFGMSYTTFDYSNFRINKTQFTPNDKVMVSVDVTNSGEMDGDEIVQIYVKTPDSPSSLERPIKRLKGFKRVTIPRGHTKTVNIEIDCADLWFWDDKNDKITFDQGRYIFEFGASSRDIRGSVEALMNGAYKPVLATVVAESDFSVLKPGNTIQTRVSGALSDDSFIDIAKAKVTYRCSNPAAASVDAEGKVTALGVGVATIFADVTFNGQTITGSYPIKVVPDLTPKSILVNGKPVANFSKDIKAYSYLLDKKTKIPVVKASAMYPGIRVEIRQAEKVPGTAIVKMIDDVTYEIDTYYLNFDVKSTSDEFNGNLEKSGWQWLREDPAFYSMSKNPGSLTITSQPGDISERTNNGKNILLQSANNDWTIETKLTASRVPSQPENTGILAYQDDDNFVKLMFRAVVKTSQMGRPSVQRPGTIDLMMEENGIAKSFAAFDVPEPIVEGNPLILRLEKKGSLYTAYYSLDGTKFNMLGTASALLKDIHVGLIVSDGIIAQYMKSIFWFDSDTTKPDSPFDVSFDYFRISNNGLKTK